MSINCQLKIIPKLLQATKVGIEEWLPIFAEMTEASLRNQFSTIVTNELGDTVVGVLLNSVWSREDDEKKKKETGKADHDISGFSQTMQRFCEFLEIMMSIN